MASSESEKGSVGAAKPIAMICGEEMGFLSRLYGFVIVSAKNKCHGNWRRSKRGYWIWR